MNGLGPLCATSNGTLFALRKPVQRVEKCADCGHLDGESRHAPQVLDRRDASGERQKASRIETDGAGPLWHGPRLRAPFVAQYIGQVLGTPRAVLEKTYGPAPALRGHIVDTRT